MNQRKDNDYIKLLEHLYFVEGLEELRHIGWLKRKYAIEWSKIKGEKLCQVIFALVCGENPRKLLKALNLPTKQ